MAGTEHWIGGNRSYNSASAWQEGVVPSTGDTAYDTTAGFVLIGGSSGTAALEGVTFVAGLQQSNTSAASQTGLSATNFSFPSSFTYDVTLPGGTYTGGTSGPVINASFGTHGAVNFAGTINVGPGDDFSQGIDSSAGQGVFNNTGIINLSGLGTNRAYAQFVLGTQSSSDVAGAYVNYGTVNVNDGTYIANVTDLPSAGSPTGTSTFNISNTGYLRFISKMGANTTVNMRDGTNDRLILAPDTAAGAIEFAGIINGFQIGNKIGLVNTASVGSLNYDPGTSILTVLDTSGGTIASLNIAGPHKTSDFSFVKNPTPTGSFSTEYDIAVTGTPPSDGLSVKDNTTGTTIADSWQPYTGPVANLEHQYINTSSDNLSVSVTVPNVFVHTGSGTDAIDVSGGGGTNVLDGGTGSNFLVGGRGSGADTFFVDDRGPSADIWSTMVNFHAGDAATLFGVTQQGATLDWENNQGAAGYTGLTLHALVQGAPTASLTLTGFTTDDLTNGRLTTSFGTEPDGTSYLYIHANS